MKHIGLGLLSTVVLVAVLIQPAKAQTIQLNLAPHGSKTIENSYPVSLNATCTINSNEENTIQLNLLEETGIVNGKHLCKGQSTSVVLNKSHTLSVHAEPGSKVNIQNLSNNTIQANCSV